LFLVNACRLRRDGRFFFPARSCPDVDKQIKVWYDYRRGGLGIADFRFQIADFGLRNENIWIVILRSELGDEESRCGRVRFFAPLRMTV
jgi:hypothetical protein